MDQKQRERLEKRLQAMRERALKAIRQVEEDEDPREGAAGREETRFHTHMADLGSDAEEREREFMIAAMESDLVARIDEALELLISDPDRYEICDRCGRQIAFERLELVPWTRLCARCAAAEEGGEA